MSAVSWNFTGTQKAGNYKPHTASIVSVSFLMGCWSITRVVSLAGNFLLMQIQKSVRRSPWHDRGWSKVRIAVRVYLSQINIPGKYVQNSTSTFNDRISATLACCKNILSASNSFMSTCKPRTSARKCARDHKIWASPSKKSLRGLKMIESIKTTLYTQIICYIFALNLFDE